MALTDGVEGDNAISSQNTSSSEEHLQEVAMLKQDEGHFPFLRLPAEIRNEIYWEVIEYEIDRWEIPSLLRQPAITRVNRQTRAETLKLYYRCSLLEVRTSSTEEWVPSVQKVLDAFNGGPRGLPGGSRSTLQFLGTLEVSFSNKADEEVFITIGLSHRPLRVITKDPEDDSEVVVVGSPDMDWTDAAAVQAACNEAATKLADDIKRRTTPVDEDVELVAASTPADQRAALDALRLFALACPHIRPHACISDESNVEIYEGTESYFTDEYPDTDEDEHPDTDEDEHPDIEEDKHPDTEEEEYPDSDEDEYPDSDEEPGVPEDPTYDDILEELYFIMNRH